MGSVGIFAGRGDTVIGFIFAMLIGVWVGWQLAKFWYLRNFKNEKK